ncbi:MAG: leucine-rich repeat domain-containing protein [Clostridiales Family XIII bacterium]|nr:leucine-rich repeat domain-containing protein [Clostridiales Family XIII bacterium]
MLRKYNKNKNIFKNTTALVLVGCLLITGSIIGTNPNFAYATSTDVETLAEGLAVSVPNASLTVDVTAETDNETMIKIPATVEVPADKGYALTLSTAQNDIGGGEGTIIEPLVLSGLSAGYATDSNTTETDSNRIVNGFDSAYTPYENKTDSQSKYAAFPEAGNADAEQIIKDVRLTGTDTTNLYIAVRADKTTKVGTYHLKLNLRAEDYPNQTPPDPLTGYTVKYDMNPNEDIVSLDEASEARAAAPAEETYELGEDVQLAYIPLVKNSAQITTPLWNTKADGTGTWYEGNQVNTGGFDAAIGDTITLYAQWINGFKFTVVTDGPSQIFNLPTEGIIFENVPATQEWDIDWGDSNGSIDDDVSVTLHTPVTHTYVASGSRQVTVWPSYYENELQDLVLPNAEIAASRIYQWFADFGNGFLSVPILYLTTIDSPLDIFMTRTKDQIIDQEDEDQPNYEWVVAFYYCSDNSFNMGPKFNMPQSIIKVGEGFAYGMFAVCDGDAFTMGEDFNLPQSIVEVGDDFADEMFSGCRGDAFNMNGNFNLPQGIESAGNSFAYYMFGSCSGDLFKMNDNFNLPQNITKVGNNFAADMFYDCSGDAFTMGEDFNIPPGIKEIGGGFVAGMFGDCNGINFQVNNIFKLVSLATSYDVPDGQPYVMLFTGITANSQTRSASSIVNGAVVTYNGSPVLVGHNVFGSAFADYNTFTGDQTYFNPAP